MGAGSRLFYLPLSIFMARDATRYSDPPSKAAKDRSKDFPVRGQGMNSDGSLLEQQKHVLVLNG